MSDRGPDLFCVVPQRLAETLLEPLRRHYASDPRVHVVVDRRQAPRRQPRPTTESDRRRPSLVRRPPDLPPELAEAREAVRFVQRLVPVSGTLADARAEELVSRVRDGEPQASTELYWRCFERVHSRLSVLLGDPQSADSAVAPALGAVLDAVEEGADGAEPFETVLYEAVDRSARSGLIAEAAEAPLELAAEPSLAIADPLLDEPVAVVDRDPRWFGYAQSERDVLLGAAPRDVAGVEHVGGTALVALPGRPIVDLLVGVAGDEVPERLRDVLLDRGYEDCGDAGTPGRDYYRRRGAVQFDVHVVEHEGPLWRQAVGFRDHLRAHRPQARRWAAARVEAARQSRASLLGYAEARTPALAAVLAAMQQSAEPVA